MRFCHAKRVGGWGRSAGGCLLMPALFFAAQVPYKWYRIVEFWALLVMNDRDLDGG